MKTMFSRLFACLMCVVLMLSSLCFAEAEEPLNGTCGENLTWRIEGNTLYIYGVYDKTGAVRYDGLSDPPRVGDTVVLHGPVKKYVIGGKTTVELMRARLIGKE